MLQHNERPFPHINKQQTFCWQILHVYLFVGESQTHQRLLCVISSEHANIKADYSETFSLVYSCPEHEFLIIKIDQVLVPLHFVLNATVKKKQYFASESINVGI